MPGTMLTWQFAASGIPRKRAQLALCFGLEHKNTHTNPLSVSRASVRDARRAMLRPPATQPPLTPQSPTPQRPAPLASGWTPLLGRGARLPDTLHEPPARWSRIHEGQSTAFSLGEDHSFPAGRALLSPSRRSLSTTGNPQKDLNALSYLIWRAGLRRSSQSRREVVEF